MKIRYFSCLFFVITVCFVCNKSFGQKQGQEKIDSLRNALKNYKSKCNKACLDDSIKVKYLNQLAKELSSGNPDTALVLSTDALAISEKINWKIGMGQSYLQISVFNRLNGDYKLSLQFNFKSLAIWEQMKKDAIQDPKSYDLNYLLARISTVLGNIGIIYEEQANYLKALDYYFEAVKIDDKLGNKEGVARHFVNIGLIYQEQGNYSKALDYYFKALKFGEETGNNHLIKDCIGNMAGIYSYQKDYAKALDYYFRALKINEQLEDKIGIVSNLSNIGLVYQEKIFVCLQKRDTAQADLNSSIALEYYSKALKTNKEIYGDTDLANTLDNIGSIYFYQKNYPNALNYFSKSLKISEDIGDNSGIAVQNGNIGAVYTSMKNYTQAENHLLLAVKISDSIHTLSTFQENQMHLSELYEATNDYKKALLHYKTAIDAKDSLFNQDKTKEITRLEMNYQFDKQQDSTKAAQDKKDVITQQEIARQKIIRNSILGGTAGIALIGFLGFRNFRNKRKREKAELSQQVSATEMKALRSQMNPHFIFNALQSIQTFLVSHRSEEANIYLLKFSRLMRAVLENSQYSEVPLKDDIQALELYMQLESIRLQHPFTYQFHIDENVDTENDTIPPLILQPFVENAIWHGLQYKPEPGHIDIFISKKDNALHAIVEDNGVGRDMSKQVTQPMLLKKESLGMKLTEDRLKILNEVKKIKAQFTITDLFSKSNQPAGTKVEVLLPLTS